MPFGELKQAACWCGAERYRPFYDGPWLVGSDVKVGRVELVRCSGCGTVRTREMSDVAHTSGDHTGGHFCSTEPRSWDRLNALVISRYLKNGSRVLDIGCNTGQLMSLLQAREYVTEGIESNADAVRVAKERGLNVREGRLGEQLGIGEFDAVVLSHLIEHLSDPMTALAQAAKLTMKGGLLFIFVPNVASARARARLQTWSPLMPVDHVWQFSPSTLAALVKKSQVWKPIWCRSTALNDASPHVWARPLHWVARVVNLGEQVALVGERA